MAAGLTHFFFIIEKLHINGIEAFPEGSVRPSSSRGCFLSPRRPVRRGGRLAPVQLPLPLSLSPSPVRVTRPGEGGQLCAVCPRAEPGCFDHSSRGRVRTGRRHRRSPSRAPCRRPRPPAWRRAHLTLSPRELPVLPEASPEAPRPAVASAGPCGTGCCPSLSTPTPHPAPRAPGGRGQVGAGVCRVFAGGSAHTARHMRTVCPRCTVSPWTLLLPFRLSAEVCGVVATCVPL